MKKFFLFHGMDTVESILDGGFMGVADTHQKAIEEAKRKLVYYPGSRKFHVVEVDVVSSAAYITNRNKEKGTFYVRKLAKVEK